MHSDSSENVFSIRAMTKKSTRITISLAEKEHRELCALSEKHDLSMSWLARQAVSEFLKRYEEGEAQLPLTLPAQRKAGVR